MVLPQHLTLSARHPVPLRYPGAQFVLCRRNNHHHLDSISASL